jgi:hypothetical protein
MVHLCAGKTTDNAKTVAQQHFATIFSSHGLPNMLVTDQDPCFSSWFWKALHSMLDTHLMMSSTFHPQTNSQKEWMNCTVEQILRLYIDYRQTNWEELLPSVEFAINNHQRLPQTTHPFFSITDFILTLQIPPPSPLLPFLL